MNSSTFLSACPGRATCGGPIRSCQSIVVTYVFSGETSRHRAQNVCEILHVRSKSYLSPHTMIKSSVHNRDIMSSSISFVRLIAVVVTSPSQRKITTPPLCHERCAECCQANAKESWRKITALFNAVIYVEFSCKFTVSSERCRPMYWSTPRAVDDIVRFAQINETCWKICCMLNSWSARSSRIAFA